MMCFQMIRAKSYFRGHRTSMWNKARGGDATRVDFEKNVKKEEKKKREKRYSQKSVKNPLGPSPTCWSFSPPSSLLYPPMIMM